MGFNTTVFLLNDRLDEIKRNPQQFVEEVYQAILSHGRDKDRWITGQTTVMPTAHADVHRLYMSHGNAMIDLSYPYSAKEELLKNGGDQKRLVWMIEYYRENLKIAKSIMKDWERELKKLEEKEKIERCSHDVWKADHCYKCEKAQKKNLAK